MNPEMTNFVGFTGNHVLWGCLPLEDWQGIQIAFWCMFCSIMSGNSEGQFFISFTNRRAPRRLRLSTQCGHLPISLFRQRHDHHLWLWIVQPHVLTPAADAWRMLYRCCYAKKPALKVNLSEWQCLAPWKALPPKAFTPHHTKTSWNRSSLQRDAQHLETQTPRKCLDHSFYA